MKKSITYICFVISIVLAFLLLPAMIFIDCNGQKLQQVSTFSTTFSRRVENRAYNIALATSKFSWFIVEKDGSVSFNDIVGKRDEENGYKDSKVILNGEYVQGIGGGVCQVSTTLYNAWIRAGLDVETVRGHSLAPSYVELSQDATVSEYWDLVLKNNSNANVIINGKVIDNKITFDIYAKDKEYNIQIITKILNEILPPPPKIEYLSASEEPQDNFIKRNAKVGYHSLAYMNKYKKGKLVESKKIREDYYLPTQAILVKYVD